MVLWEKKISVIDKALVRLTKIKGKKHKNIRNETDDFTADPEAFKNITKRYYQQFYAHKLDKLKERAHFLTNQKLPRLNLDETEILNF